MPTFLRELFELYVKRLIMKGGQGIKQIPNKDRVKLMADNLYKDFKQAGVPDNILRTENDIKVFHHKIAEINNQNIAREFEHMMTPKKSADILPFKFKKSFGEEIDSMIKKGEVNVGTADKTPTYKPSKSQTDFEIQERYRAENAKAIKRFEDKMKKDPEDLADGGVAGMLGEPTYADGGRIGFAGGLNAARRAFLKMMGAGAAGIGAAKSGLFSLLKGGAGKKAVTEVAKDVAGSGTPPPYFFKLVEKIKKLGDDVTETGALAERQKVKQYKDFEMTEDISTGQIQIQKKGGNYIDDETPYQLTEEVYMSHTPGETIIGKNKKPIKVADDYVEDTSYIRNDGPNTGSIHRVDDGVPQSVLDEVGEAVVKKADGGRIGYGLGKKVVETVIKKAGEGKFTKNQVLEQMFKNTIKQSKSADTKKRFLNFIEEIKVKPELSKDPNVWNFFTKGMPKNQKLVVYGDDTVDFWTQSEFGPHNIATSAKFQKKHPYLTKDQAIKIQNMEPEDQIFEMKRLEVLRKRTANATGGRVSLSAGGLAGMLGE